MKFIKINNLIDQYGTCNYKGLEIDKIVPSSQLYPETLNVAYFAYDGEVVESEDITILSEEEYLNTKKEYEESLPKSVDPEEELQQLKLAMAEMAEAHELEKTEMQLALAELAELLGGEVKHG